MIANCGHDEDNHLTGGMIGDQTRKEFCIRDWYSYPWTHVIRFRDQRIAHELARLARDSANNDHIGYDQSNRYSFYYALIDAKYEPKDIDKDCETDCSSSTSALLIATGKNLKIPELYEKILPIMTTKNLLSSLRKLDTKISKAKKFISSCNYLNEGDLLLAENHHIAINLDNGLKTVDSMDYRIGNTYTTCINYTPVYTSTCETIKKSYIQLTSNAQSHANSKGELLIGTKVTVKEVRVIDGIKWIRIPSGYIKACERGAIYVK